MKNSKTLYQFIIDQSGSMEDCRLETVESFNKQIETLKELSQQFSNQEFLVNTTKFNHEISHQLTSLNPNVCEKLTLENYLPSGTTALLDSIGTSIQRIERNHGAMLEMNEMSIVVVILTDGHENSSRIFSHKYISNKISKLEKTGNWTFSFLGAGINAWEISDSLMIRKENVMAFDKCEFSESMNDIPVSMEIYAEEKEKGFIKKNFLDNIKEKDKRKFQ